MPALCGPSPWLWNLHGASFAALVPADCWSPGLSTRYHCSIPTTFSFVIPTPTPVLWTPTGTRLFYTAASSIWQHYGQDRYHWESAFRASHQEKDCIRKAIFKNLTKWLTTCLFVKSSSYYFWRNDESAEARSPHAELLFTFSHKVSTIFRSLVALSYSLHYSSWFAASNWSKRFQKFLSLKLSHCALFLCSGIQRTGFHWQYKMHPCSLLSV